MSNDNNKIRVVFMGTPDFAVPTLCALNSNPDIEVLYCVTKIDKKSNRGNKLNFSEVKKKAIELNIPIYQPLSIKKDIDLIDKMKNSNIDFIVVVAFGQILSKEILDIPKYGCINGHASLLPKYRGSSPIQSAILNGDTISGVSTMLMNEGCDTGDILLKEEIELDKKENTGILFDKLSNVTADLIIKTIKDFKNINPEKQNENEATKAFLINKEDGLLNIKNEDAITIERKIRAYDPWPSAYINTDKGIIKIFDADVLNDNDLINLKININDDNKYFLKDDIFIYDKKYLIIKTKKDYLKINKLQLEGKNKIDTKDFINGLRI